MSDIEETQPETNISINNYPPDSVNMSLRTIAFGGPGKMKLLLEVGMNDAGTEVDIDLTLDFGAPHEEIPEYLTDIIGILESIRDSSQPAVDAKLAELRDEQMRDDDEEDEL